MKRNLFLPLALLLAAVLSGCVEPAPEEDRGFDSARSFAHYQTNVYAAETPDTIYFMTNGYFKFIKYVDKATGISGVLCGKPECRHNDSDCNAYVMMPKFLFVDSGRLYWITTESTQLSPFTDCVYSMAPDGTDRRKEAELPPDLSPSGISFNHYLLCDGWIYYSTVSDEIKDGVQTHYNYVAAASLASKQESATVILLEETNAALYDDASIQFYGGYLYILTSNYNVSSGEDEYLADCRLRRWRAETGELETLYEDYRSPLNFTSELWVTDGGVFFNRNTSPTADAPLENRIYRYDFDSGECEHIFDNGMYGWPDQTLIADDLITGYGLMKNDGGIYDFYVVLKDFEGNVLVDKTYTLDIRDGYTGYGRYGIRFLGRDEEYAYYSFSGSSDNINYVSIISAALDGSGARVMCTQSEQYGG